MSDRFGTLMYIPHENSNVKSIRLSRRTAIGLSSIGVGLGTLLAGLVVFAVTGGGAGSADAAVENHQLRTELAAMEGQVATLGQKLESLLDREEELRLVADLPPVPVEVQAVGIGGPGHSFFLADGEGEAPGDPALRIEESPIEESPIGETLEETSTTIDMLLRRSELVASSMNEVRKSIATKKARFEATPSIWPTSGFLSSTFSLHRSHPIFHDVRPHYGIDISSRRGNPIVATAAGKVIRAGWESGHGNLVVIDHGGGLRTAYSHASRVLVRAGQNVERGDTIALVGSTGFSMAPHVHYEVHEDGQPVDPLKYIFPDAIAD